MPLNAGAERRSSTVLRIFIVAGVLLSGTLYLAHASRAEEIPARQSLTSFPMNIQAWSGRREPDFTREILGVLGVDDYITRSYYRKDSLPIGLYVGYYASQRQGDTIHSPLNCLPGAGWIPVEQGHTRIAVRTSPETNSTREIEVNRVVIQKGLDRELVLYWYQSHGRVVASEYWGKIYTVVDAVRYNRTDAALVRVVVPIPDRGDVSRVDRTGTEFVQSVFPLLTGYIPAA